MRTVLPVLVVLPLLSGCSLLERTSEPRVPAAQDMSWSSTLLQAETFAPEPLASRITDPQLGALVQKLAQENLDLAAARARIAEARALKDQDLARFGLQVGSSGSVTANRQSETGLLPVGDVPGFERDQILYEAGFDVSWEADFFNRRDLIEELGRIGIDGETLSALSLASSLTADLIRFYVDAAAARLELDLVDEIIARQADLLSATELRRAHGEASDLDVERASVALTSTEARKPALERAEAVARARIAVLTGQAPSQLILETPETLNIITQPSQLAETTSDVLRRRPDVLIAELDYAGAAAALDLSKLDYYPSVSLLGSLGTETTEISDLLDPASLAASLGGLVNWALLDGGQREAGITGAGARLDLAEANYRATVLRAVEDVESSALLIRETGAELRTQEDIEASRRKIAEMARLRYEGGTGTLLDVLETEEDLIEAEIALTRLRARHLLNEIGLEKALGLILAANDAAIALETTT